MRLHELVSFLAAPSRVAASGTQDGAPQHSCPGRFQLPRTLFLQEIFRSLQECERTRARPAGAPRSRPRPSARLSGTPFRRVAGMTDRRNLLLSWLFAVPILLP